MIEWKLNSNQLSNNWMVIKQWFNPVFNKDKKEDPGN